MRALLIIHGSNVLLLECTNTIDSTLHCVCGVAFRFIVYQHIIVAQTTVYTTVRIGVDLNFHSLKNVCRVVTVVLTRIC